MRRRLEECNAPAAYGVECDVSKYKTGFLSFDFVAAVKRSRCTNRVMQSVITFSLCIPSGDPRLLSSYFARVKTFNLAHGGLLFLSCQKLSSGT